MMKKNYITPDFQAVLVENADVLTTSGKGVVDIGGGDLGISGSDLFRNGNQ